MSQVPCRDKSISTQQGKFLELSPKHFLPVSPGSGQSFQEAVMKQARSVVPGDTVWAVESSQATAFGVAHVEAVTKKGLWAPYTKRGTIVVNGVIASVHSDWVLDSLLEAIGRPELLPLIYQVLLSLLSHYDYRLDQSAADCGILRASTYTPTLPITDSLQHCCELWECAHIAATCSVVSAFFDKAVHGSKSENRQKGKLEHTRLEISSCILQLKLLACHAGASQPSQTDLQLDWTFSVQEPG